MLLPIVLLAASMFGWRVQRSLPERHRTHETRDAVRLVLSMLVTFAALVLGLLTSSAKSHFDSFGNQLQQYSIDLISIDQLMREYGPAAEPLRATLRSYTAAAFADTWPDERPPSGTYPVHMTRSGSDRVESAALGAMLLDLDRKVAELTPITIVEQAAKRAAVTRVQAMLQHRWMLVASAQTTLSWPFLGVMTAWLMLTFAAFGLSTPDNWVVVTVIGLTALSLSVAAWLIVELDGPLTGVLQVTSTALRDALVHMDVAEGG